LSSDEIGILICGDSFCVTDPDFQGLHWSEKLLNYSSKFKVYNLAHGGCSNALISLQLLHGLRLNPDFVIFSFTDVGRYEFDSDINALPNDMTDLEITSYMKKRFTTNSYEKNVEKIKITDRWLVTAASENMEIIKNYMYLLNCMMTCNKQGIPFCYSIGGFMFGQGIQSFMNSNYIKNFLNEYHDQELMTNLWNYSTTKTKPWFHVEDDAVQTLFANECIDHILRKKSC
jgi:hypothetical protein